MENIRYQCWGATSTGQLILISFGAKKLRNVEKLKSFGKFRGQEYLPYRLRICAIVVPVAAEVWNLGEGQ